MRITGNINIQIGGEIGRFNSLPIDYLVNIAKNLQDLVQTIAEVSIIDKDTIDLNNFKIELVGFTAGSAVPSFAFTNRIQATLGHNIENDRQTVYHKFEELLAVADKGDFGKIKTLYPGGYQRNKIVGSYYEFTKSLGTSPVNVVNIETENNQHRIVPLYKIRKINKESRDDLMVQLIESKDSDIQEDIRVRKVRTVTKNGGKKTTTLEEYSGTKASLSYAPSTIVHENTTYELTAPLRCLLEKEDDYYVIICELLDIIGTGTTMDEAEKSFSQEFDFIYKRYNQLDEKTLAKRLLAIKTILNLIVKSKS